MVLFYYALGVTFGWCAVSLFLLVKSRTISSLEKVVVAEDFHFPELTIVIPVRNEETHLAMALESVCRLDYPRYHIIVMEDRSTDLSPEIVDRFARQNNRITAVHIKELPEGWLGKNHALWLGASQTKSEWLLFTDADVVFKTDALKKAMFYAVRHHLDHVTIFPDVISSSRILNSILETFKMMLELRLRPWKVSDPRSRASLGIGAFNLVKRSAYETIGTHRSVALRPDDDLKLGEKLKRAGFRQEVLYGKNELGLEWYPNTRAFVNGLMKNMFSGFGYNIFKVIAAAVLTFLVFVLPVPLFLIAGSFTIRLSGLIILGFQIMLYLGRPGQRACWWYAVMIPYAGSVMIYILLASAIRTLRQGGIYWRDHFYSLNELRKGFKNP